MILATLGPKFNQINQIMQAITKYNVKIFRINLSHGNSDNWRFYLNLINQVKEKLNDDSIQIMGDIQGPKFRIGDMKEKKYFKVNDQIVFSSNKDQIDEIYLPHFEIANVIQINDKIILSDGELLCQVQEKQYNSNSNYKLICKCLCNGYLSSRKGISISRHIKTEIPTDVDKISIKFMDENNFDLCMMSFIQDVNDIEIYKQQFKLNKNIKFISKIETVPAIENLENIVKQSDIIMIARGDLGVECGQHQVPYLTDKITEQCIKYNKECLIATQFMIGELEHGQPNCAEGVKGILLTQETAMNEKALQCLEKLQKIINSQ